MVYVSTSVLFFKNTDSPNKDVIEGNGKKAWNDAYSAYLN
jgi:hypothetical protein